MTTKKIETSPIKAVAEASATPEHRVKTEQRETLAKQDPQPVTAKGVDYCPRCGLTGAEIGSCGNFAIGCPTPVAADKDKVVTVKCGPCNKTLTIPVGNIMRRKLANIGSCVKGECAATIIS